MSATNMDADVHHAGAVSESRLEMNRGVARIAPTSTWPLTDGYALMRLMQRLRMLRGHIVCWPKAVPLRMRRLFSLYQTFARHRIVLCSQVEHVVSAQRQVSGRRSPRPHNHLDPQPGRRRFGG